MKRIWERRGWPGTAGPATRRVGVCPPIAAAIVRAQFAQLEAVA